MVPELTRDLEKGFVMEDGVRVVTLRIKTFQAFFDKLQEVAGQSVAAILSDQMGRAVDLAGMSYSMNKIQSRQDLGRVLDEVMCTRGWGRCISLTEHEEDGKIVFTATLQNQPLNR